jgi:hypothetical protein
MTLTVQTRKAAAIAVTDETPDEAQARPVDTLKTAHDPRSWTAMGVLESMRDWRRRFPNADPS